MLALFSLSPGAEPGQAAQPVQPQLFESLMKGLAQANGAPSLYPQAPATEAASVAPAASSATLAVGAGAASGLPDPTALLSMLAQPQVGSVGVGAAQQPAQAPAMSLGGLQSLFAQMQGAGASAGVGAAAAGLPPPLQALAMMQGMGAGMPPEVTELAQTMGSAVNGAREMVGSIQAAEQYFKPQQLVQDAIHAVQDLPEGVKTQVRDKAEDLLKEVPSELQDFLKTQMGTLIERLPAHLKGAFNQRPDYLLEHGSELVANLTDAERDDLLKTTRSVVSETMKHVLAKPDALLAGITKLVDSLPPEFTKTVSQVQSKMLMQAEQVVQHLPAGLLGAINEAVPGAIPRPLESQAQQSASTIFLGAQPTVAVDAKAATTPVQPVKPAVPSFLPGSF